MQLGKSPAVAAVEHAPSRMLRHAMWLPTNDDEHAVSTAVTHQLQSKY